MRMIDEDEVRLKEKPKDSRYIKTRSSGSVGKGLGFQTAIIGTADSSNGQGRHSLEGPGRAWNPYPIAPQLSFVMKLWEIINGTGDIENNRCPEWHLCAFISKSKVLIK